jgi:UDP-2,3-diacylglucosamine hydrolase
MTTLFVSDLHLDPSRPDITALFLQFLREEAAHADALYILGDLFEAWVGDDVAGEPAAGVREALRALVDAGVPVYFMRGNRDFLVGQRFAAETGARLLPDPAVVPLYGEPTLVMHGDLLCTADTAYQGFRAQVRDPAWQARFLAQPLPAREAFAAQARAASKEHQRDVGAGGAMDQITDVAPDAVASTLARYGVRRLIHGHTHRPAIHALDAGGRSAQRVVLGDWYTQGSVLRVDPDGLELAALAPA